MDHDLDGTIAITGKRRIAELNVVIFFQFIDKRGFEYSITNAMNINNFSVIIKYGTFKASIEIAGLDVKDFMVGKAFVIIA